MFLSVNTWAAVASLENLLERNTDSQAHPKHTEPESALKARSPGNS